MTSTIIDYISAIYLYKSKKEFKKYFLLLSLASNLGLLFTFKYYNFFHEILNQFFSFSNINVTIPELNVLLPVGISFYTFQTLSYTIDVYYGKREPERIQIF